MNISKHIPHHLIVIFLLGNLFPLYTQGENLDKDLHLKRYAALGKFWGFMKYYHPKIAVGEIEWDRALIEILEEDTFWKSNQKLNKGIEILIKKAGTISECNDCKSKFNKKESLNADWSWMSNSSLFSKEISNYLIFLKDNHRPSKNIYIERGGGGYRKYAIDSSLIEVTNPRRSVRLLALFQYWNVIEYFYPYKYLEPRPWIEVLHEFIPIFLDDQDARNFALNMYRLTKQIKDSHANISHSPLGKDLFGIYQFPFRLTSLKDTSIWIETILVDSIANTFDIKAGDRLVSLNGVNISDIIHSISPYIASSNQSAFRRYLCERLAFDTLQSANIAIEREGKLKTLNIPRYTYEQLYKGEDSWILGSPEQQLRLGQNKEILYINMGRVKQDDIEKVIESLSESKGVIFDLRFGVNMRGDEFAEYLGDGERSYSSAYLPNFDYPGYFSVYNTFSFEGNRTTPYLGEIVILVNERVQSRSEITTMFFQALSQTVVIGTQSAGTVSTISKIALPAGYMGVFTNVCLTYPDGRLVQGEGVKVDIPVNITKEGLRNGEDEILQAALKYLNIGKK